MREQGNLLLAILLSLLILLGFQYFYEVPNTKKEIENKQYEEKMKVVTDFVENCLLERILKSGRALLRGWGGEMIYPPGYVFADKETFYTNQRSSDPAIES